MERLIKSSSIPMGGYLYQNYVGLELLCDWLDDPGLYQWIKFEADQETIPKGLDDIVALQKDNRLVLLQVKFTVDPDNSQYHLTWDWLLQHTPKGRSLLQKWFDSAFSIGLENIAETALITNRQPERKFYDCLNKATGHIETSLIPEDIKTKLIEQMVDEEAIEQFFKLFRFNHSHQHYLSLQRTLLNRYVPTYTDFSGWNYLFRESIDWAVRTNFPFPDGQITLILLRSVLNTKRPTPLTQSFRIPEGYCVPDDAFSDGFIQNIIEHPPLLRILWGSPGQGKSTFLSYFCTRLEELEIPYIRHHYFLELGDTSDRFSYHNVSHSLMAQMEANHIEYVEGLANNPEELPKWIETCANGYQSIGKRFIIIIDGLDHVWRENEQNKKPLDSLFKHLFPIPENVTLIIGTQKVAEEQLPIQFPTFVGQADWIELPRMSLASIREWLSTQYRAERFELDAKHTQETAQSLVTLAESFQKITNGHPLHLTYSFESIIREERILTPDTIEKLPACPEGDIKKYYQTLWRRFSYPAKDALHLVADAGFIWPHLGLEECLSVGAGDLNSEIGHLFYITEAGQLPFHGSILAFILEKIEHEERIKQLLPSIINWLKEKAPLFHHWGWLWLYQARLGNNEALIKGPSREWIINSLAKAYPKEQIIEIMTSAERAAFEQSLFARAVRLRWLKIRLINGLEFQLDDQDRLYRCALKITDDDFPQKNLSAGFHAASIDELHTLSMQYLYQGRETEAVECSDEIRNRINDRIKARAYEHGSLKTMLEQHLEIIAATKNYDNEKLISNLLNFRGLSQDLFTFFIREISKHRDLQLLTDFLPRPLPLGLRHDLELEIIRLAGLCHAKIHKWPEFDRLKKHSIVDCWAHLYAKDKSKNIRFAKPESFFIIKSHDELPQEEVKEYLHNLFFHALSKCLEISGAKPVLEEYKFTERTWLNTAADLILSLAYSAGSILARGDVPAFSFCYRLLREVEQPKAYNEYQDYVAFRHAILQISNDLFLLGSIRSGLNHIPHSEWEVVTASNHFLFSEWQTQYIENDYRIVPDNAVEESIQRQLQTETEHITEFNERLQVYLDLCELALFQRLDLPANELLKKALGCVMGYGWRKDPTMSHVLSSVSAITPIDNNFAHDCLMRLCPAVIHIDEFTDGDGTRSSKFELAEQLIDLMPNSYAGYYEHLLKSSEWYESEEVLSVLFEKKQPLMKEMVCLTKSLWDKHSVGILRIRAVDGDETAQEIITRNADFFGLPTETLGKSRSYSSSSYSEEHNIDVTGYKPDELLKMVKYLEEKGNYTGVRKAVREWVQYWIDKDHGIELLRAMEPYIGSESKPYGTEEIFDRLFEVSLELEGRDAAYKWIVAAQIYCHGWTEYYAENYEDRFKRLLEVYPTYWKQYIFDTTRSAYKGDSDQLIIPHARLVKFLIMANQTSLALEITEQLVDAVLEEVSDQPLTQPEWLTGS